MIEMTKLPTRFTFTLADIREAERAGRQLIDARVASLNACTLVRPAHDLAGLLCHTPETLRAAGICQACWGRSGYEPGYEEPCRVCAGTQRVPSIEHP